MTAGAPEASIGLLFLMGVAYGSSACLLSCSPLLVPLLAGSGGSMMRSVRIVALFSLGRIVAYSAVGAMAAFASAWIEHILKNKEVTQKAMGILMIFIALYLLYRTFASGKEECGSSCSLRPLPAKEGIALVGLGALFSFNLCPPLYALSALSAAGGSIAAGAVYGAAFGFGSTLVAAIFYGFIVAAIARGFIAQFARQRMVFETVASLGLMGAGVLVYMGRLAL